VEDLEEPSLTCEMCESAEVRFVHYMTHPDYPETLGVGCVCAEHMEEDYVGPRIRERQFRTVARRRRTWRAKQWKTSSKGNPYLNTEGFNLAVFPKGDGWGFKIESRATGQVAFAHRTYRTEQDAKDGTLIAVVWAKNVWAKSNWSQTRGN
jgi:hypothetical protein